MSATPPTRRKQQIAIPDASPPSKPVSHLLHWDDLPHWLQDNHHIRTHYRPATNSLSASFSSLSILHNETVNIYTHLIPGLLSAPLALFLWRSLPPRYASATRADVAAMGCFFAGAACCLCMSAAYHTISNHSPRVNQVGNQLDYAGIVLLIAGSFVPSVYYGFWGERALQVGYWAMISSLGAGCTVVTVMPRFRSPAFRPIRASMFVALGLSAVFPVFHGVKRYGLEQSQRQIGLFWVVLQGFLYILGAGFYAARIPERFRPGRFDVLGSSHQIFHVLVVCAAASHLVGLLKAFDYRHSLSSPPYH